MRIQINRGRLGQINGWGDEWVNGVGVSTYVFHRGDRGSNPGHGGGGVCVCVWGGGGCRVTPHEIRKKRKYTRTNIYVCEKRA